MAFPDVRCWEEPSISEQCFYQGSWGTWFCSITPTCSLIFAAYISTSRIPQLPEDNPKSQQFSKSFFKDSDYLVSKLLGKEMYEQYCKLEQGLNCVNFREHYYLSWN